MQLAYFFHITVKVLVLSTGCISKCEKATFKQTTLQIIRQRKCSVNISNSIIRRIRHLRSWIGSTCKNTCYCTVNSNSRQTSLHVSCMLHLLCYLSPWLVAQTPMLAKILRTLALGVQGSPQLWVQHVKEFPEPVRLLWWEFLGGPGACFQQKMFEFWVSETAFPAFSGHFWAKYKGIEILFFIYWYIIVQ